MPYFGFLLALLLLAGCSDTLAQVSGESQNRQKWELRGPVRFVEQSGFFPRGKIASTDPVPDDTLGQFRLSGRDHLYFGSDGLLTEQHRYHPQGLDWQMWFDERGYPRKGIHYAGNGAIRYLTETTYDAEGYPLRRRQMKPDSTPVHTVEYTFANNGRKIEERRGSGSRQTTVTTTYDRTGRPDERTTYSGDKLMSRATHAYDGRGNLTELTVYGPDGEALRKDELAYSDSIPSRKHTVDHQQQLTRDHTFTVEGWAAEIVTTRTKDGKPTSERQTFRYLRDERGNWVRRAEYRDGRLFALDFRRITYAGT